MRAHIACLVVQDQDCERMSGTEGNCFFARQHLETGLQFPVERQAMAGPIRRASHYVAGDMGRELRKALSRLRHVARLAGFDSAKREDAGRMAPQQDPVPCFARAPVIAVGTADLGRLG